MSGYYGDFPVGATVRLPFDTAAAAGSRVDFSGALETADFFIYKDGGTTERTSANGLTVSGAGGFDSKTGAHLLAIDLSDDSDAGFYAVGHDYSVLLYPDETVDSLAVAKWVGSFSIENRCALRPTVAGRTLDVSATGEAGVDWANVGSPTTSVTLSGTTVGTTTAVTTVNGMAANTITSSALATSAVDEIVDQVWDELRANHVANGSFGAALQIVDDGQLAAIGSTTQVTLAASAPAEADVLNGSVVWFKSGSGNGALQARIITGYTSGRVATIAPALSPALTGTVQYAVFPAPIGTTDSSIAAAVWDLARSGHATSGTFGELIPNLDATVSSRATPAQVNTEADTALSDAGVTSVRQTKLDTLPGASAGTNGGLPTVDGNNRVAGIQGTITTLDALDTAQDVEHDATQAALVVIDDFLDTEVAAIKAKTDNLPSDPADASDIATATTTITNTLGAAGAGLTAIPWNAAWDAEVQSEATDALNAYDPPTHAEVTTAVASAALTTASKESIADILLNRNINQGGNGTRTVEEALATSRNRVAISGSTLTVYDVDDTTPLYTATIVLAARNPLASIDPT
jgi:hypothetical protein